MDLKSAARILTITHHFVWAFCRFFSCSEAESTRFECFHGVALLLRAQFPQGSDIRLRQALPVRKSYAKSSKSAQIREPRSNIRTCNLLIPNNGISEALIAKQGVRGSNPLTSTARPTGGCHLVAMTTVGSSRVAGSNQRRINEVKHSQSY